MGVQGYIEEYFTQSNEEAVPFSQVLKADID